MFKLSIEQLKLIWNYYYTSLPIIILLCFLYKWFLTQSYPRKHLPPSPPRLPIIGNFHQLGPYPHRSLRSLSEIYGDLMMIYLGSSPTLIVSSAEAACEIMKIHDINFCNRSIPKTVSKITYNRRDLAATQYGEYWKQMRSICVHQLLSNTRVRSFRSVREQEMNRIIDKIEKSCSSILNMREIFMHLTNDVLCRAAYGKTYSSMEGGVNFKELLKEFLEVMGALRVGDFIPWLGWTNWLDGWDARVEKIVKDFDFILEKIVDEHQHSRRESKNDEIVQDFVDVLLEVQKEKLVGFAIDRDNIKALVLDMFFAGTDSTYTLLEWVMTELLRHPKCMKILQNEVRAITGRKLYANEDDLEQMKYLKAVIKETLRLHPPIPLLAPRQSINDIKIKGYDIPVGVGVFINAWAIHRDPATWDEPDKFIPERFLNSPIDFRGQDFQFIPFGAGRRICPGITFAIAVNELALANLMHKFDWMLPGGTDGENLDMSESIGITAHKKIALLAVATPLNAGK